MKKIQLGGHNQRNGVKRIQGYAFVDDEDFEYLNQWKWQMKKDRRTYYAQRLKSVLMHRILLTPTAGLVVDHINGNGLDNRKSNLRAVTVAKNSQNRVRLPNNNKSGVVGVYWSKRRSRWIAKMTRSGKCRQIGSFKSQSMAKIAIEKARK